MSVHELLTTMLTLQLAIFVCHKMSDHFVIIGSLTDKSEHDK